ncbi:ribbon-helix-helix domain-containing protein [Ensifer sp. SSB1]|jgi:Arc/MetJ-type ribon-helix-helix transcriptional regulator|uniref:ribbon-helix-helix domain-containing protein n=1 Tax=Ensifer sp. SSB1 TaxID=2795385 RepID=UPI001A45675A|nr:ribbon-helix-helix domain-containing protein [Ensifer sp. SSB1]MBK5568025.1 hypothetical protein [Ensifer sp. SSB1]
MSRKLIGTHVDPPLIDEIDAFVGKGMPGEPGYFSSRSEFIKAAVLLFLAQQADQPTIRRRRLVQPLDAAQTYTPDR